MQTIFLLFLFILQLFGFYIMALLYMKVSKFNDLEKKQQKLMAEMDDSVGVYLAELKEENDRLIKIIEKRQESNSSHEKEIKKQQVTQSGTVVENNKENFTLNQPSVPMKVAMKSYQTSPAVKESVTKPSFDEVKMDDRSIAIRMHKEGKSIEEIAKSLGKGKTEVNLLLKFS